MAEPRDLKPKPDGVAKSEDIPAIFATIHFRGPDRPNGYTAEDIAEMNRLANLPGRKGSNGDVTP